MAQQYFDFLKNRRLINDKFTVLTILIVALVPSAISYFALSWLPSLFAFLLHLLVLWVCLGCPVTRHTYKRYLQAAQREDFQACALHSMTFGNEGGELSAVGKQLVLVNYRQYASVIIFFVFLGLPGLIFYSVIKEWVAFEIRNHKPADTIEPTQANEAEVSNAQIDSISSQILFLLDFIPVRITAFGFLVVGHFSKALPVWFDILVNPKVSAYDALGRVSKAAEDVNEVDAHLNEPLQLVKLVKRNIVFMLMAVSLMTMVGLVA